MAQTEMLQNLDAEFSLDISISLNYNVHVQKTEYIIR